MRQRTSRPSAPVVVEAQRLGRRPQVVGVGAGHPAVPGAHLRRRAARRRGRGAGASGIARIYPRRPMALDPALVADLVARALAEDVGAGDVTTQATVPPGARAIATITQKAPGRRLRARRSPRRRSAQLDPDVEIERLARRAPGASPARRCCASTGDAAAHPHRRAHRAELPAAPAAASRRSPRATSRAIEGTGARDPRHAQDDAGAARAREGGGGRRAAATSHRFGLFDMVLIKENHVAAAGGVGRRRRARRASAFAGPPARGRVPRPRTRSPRRSRPARRASCSTT